MREKHEVRGSQLHPVPVRTAAHSDRPCTGTRDLRGSGDIVMNEIRSFSDPDEIVRSKRAIVIHHAVQRHALQTDKTVRVLLRPFLPKRRDKNNAAAERIDDFPEPGLHQYCESVLIRIHLFPDEHPETGIPSPVTVGPEAVRRTVHPVPVSGKVFHIAGVYPFLLIGKIRQFLDRPEEGRISKSSRSESIIRDHLHSSKFLSVSRIPQHRFL